MNWIQIKHGLPNAGVYLVFDGYDVRCAYFDGKAWWMNQKDKTSSKFSHKLTPTHWTSLPLPPNASSE